MRDIVVILFVVGGSLWALRRPWIGVIVWTNVSLMNPHTQFSWTLYDKPVAQMVALCTLLGMLFTKERRNPFSEAPAKALVLFIIWICITLPFSFYFDDSYVLWERSMKIFLMVFVTIALIDDRRKLNWFVGMMAFSIGFYGFKGGLFTLATGGNYRVWGPGGFIAGNNEMALALVMMIPLQRLLMLRASNRWLKRFIGLWMALTAVTVLGSYSRGALLALGAMGAFLWLKSDKKLVSGVVIVAVALTALSFMPAQWWDRMNTIKTYEADDSAMGRINAWHMAFNLASDRVLGGGFMIYTPPVFQRYAPDPDAVHAAHSIYFQILGEHGFIGLALFLLIGALSWRKAMQLNALARKHPELRWAGDLASMMQVGMIGFAVGGAFLSLAYFDLPYNMMAALVIASAVAQRELAGRARQGPSLQPLSTAAVTPSTLVAQARR